MCESLNTIRLNVFGNRWEGTEVIKLEERSTYKYKDNQDQKYKYKQKQIQR